MNNNVSVGTPFLKSFNNLSYSFIKKGHEVTIMKTYIKPTIDVIILRPEEQIACPNSCKHAKKGNNGYGNGHQPAPGNSLPHNGAENDQTPKGKQHKHHN